MGLSPYLDGTYALTTSNKGEKSPFVMSQSLFRWNIRSDVGVVMGDQN